MGTLVAAAALVAAPTAPADWPMFGQNLSNTASNSSAITTRNVRDMRVKWAITTGGDVSARAAVVNDVVYFPDWGGNLWAVAAKNGKKIWSHQLSDYGLSGSSNGVYHSRTTPAVVGGTLYLGTQEGAYLLAIDAATGALRWKTRMEPSDPYAIVTTSPAVHNGVVYSGVASIAEGGIAYGIYPVPEVRGSAVAVDAETGVLMWKTYMVPQGYSGGGVWGSNPVVDASRNTVFVSTGNNYIHPADSAESSQPGQTYGECIAAGGNAATCNSPNDHVDAVVALDMRTGAVKWSQKLVTWNQSGYGVTDGSDDWNVDCFFGGPSCPSNPGPDYDFGSTPNLITYQGANGPVTILGAGQKSGIYSAMNPDTGQLLWQTQVGPGSSLGGMEWGSASDGKRIYVQIANFYGIPHLGGYGGSWAALDPATGQILWQTADPNGSIALGPLSVSNGVVYGGSMAGDASAPTMLARDAATGQILWSFAAGASVNAGAAIVGDSIYWGAGYTHLGIPGYTGSNKFFAFVAKS
ncbi:MAG: PQQ-binding-like beta-propeller repeat protein [Vicinamibacterales bacterium]